MNGILFFGIVWFIGIICYLIVMSKVLKSRQGYHEALKECCKAYESLNNTLKEFNAELDKQHKKFLDSCEKQNEMLDYLSTFEK